MISERFPDLEGGACTELPPEVAAKYFDIDAGKQRFEAQTAKAVCGHCAIQALCLEAAVNRTAPERGIVGGMTATQIKTIRAWRSYDCGSRKTQPDHARPALPQAQPSRAEELVAEIRHREKLSFGERVYGIFLDVKQGKYKTLNEAIGDIALIHSQIIEDMQS
jgi:hypothetical protein